MIESFLNSTPWYWPALAIAIAISLATFRPLARVLDTPRALTFVLVLSLTGIVALTLTPGNDAFSPYLFQDCFVRLVRPIGFERIANLGERGLNVLLFVPLGLAIGALPRSRVKLGLAIGALALPLVIEGIQYVFPALDRSCSSIDVVDNLTGVVVGLSVGLIARLVVSIGSKPSRGDPQAEIDGG
jgi:glycopeptide antibiotics resistance protein